MWGDTRGYEVVNKNSFDWLTTYKLVCGNSHVSICSINDGALFGGGCEETREDAIFFMCEGPIRVEQILAGRNPCFWELSPFLNFFWNTNERLDFWGPIDWRPTPLKIGEAAKSGSLQTRAEPARNTKQSALTKRAFCHPLHPLRSAFLVDF